MAERVQIIIDGKDNASTAFGAVKRGLQGISQEAGKVGLALSASVTAPVVAAGKQMLTAAMDYEASMNMFQAVSGATGEQMAEVGKLAQALGADMQLPATSAADASDAMVELAKAGLSVEDTMGAAKGTLQLAAAGALSEADAATIAANALQAFHLKGAEAVRVSDLLAAAANASSAEVKDVADSLKMASAVFASAGVPIEDLTANIAQMANAGIRGSDAGTSLKQMMLSLQAPTKKSKELMQDLGISVYDAQGNMRPMRDVIGQFSSSLNGLTQEQRNAALAVIFGSDAVRAANIVMMGGVDAFDAAKDAVTRAGAAHELAAARMKGLKGAIEGLKSQFETLALQVIVPLLPKLTELVTSIANLVPRFMELDPTVRNAALAFVAILAAAGPIHLALSGVAMVVGALLSPVGLLTIGAVALGTALAMNLGGSLDFVSMIFPQVLAAVQSLIPPFQALVSTIVTTVVPALMAVVNTAITYWPQVQSTITAVLSAVWGVISSVIGVIVAFWNQNHQAIMATVTTTFNTVFSIISTVLANVQTIVTTVLGIVQGFVNAHGQEIVNILRQAWDAISLLIQVALALIQATLVPMLNNFTNYVKTHGTEISTFLDTTWNLINSIIQLALDLITGILRIALAAIKGDWTTVWTEVKNLAQTIWNDIRNVIDSALKAIDNLLGGALSKFLSDVTTTFNNIKSTIEGIINGVVGWIGSIRIPNPFAAIEGFVNDMRGRIQGALDWLGSLHVPNPFSGLSIPGFASGTDNFPGGLAIVGERGPELVQLPRGTIIRDNVTTERILSRAQDDKGGSKSGGTVNNYYLTANYAYQPERKLADDVRMLQLLGSAT